MFLFAVLVSCQCLKLFLIFESEREERGGKKERRRGRKEDKERKKRRGTQQ